MCEDLAGEDHRFAAYVSGLYRNLTYFPNAKGGPASSLQRDIHSLYLYPFSVVIEKTGTPRREFVPMRRGTQWAPFELGD